MKVTVLGSGAGALSVAADLSRHGRDVVMADLPEFAGNLVPVREQGGVRVITGGQPIDPVTVVDDLAAAVARSELLIVVVPSFGHEPWLKALLPHLRSGQSLIFMGEGSGALVSRPGPCGQRQGRRHLGRDEFSALCRPCSRPGGRQRGSQGRSHLPCRPSRGLFACAAGGDRRRVALHDGGGERVGDRPHQLQRYRPRCATILSNAGTIENRTGGMLLWGEGATPSVVRVIEAVDGELLGIRKALGLANLDRYRDLLIKQGFATDAGPSLYEVLPRQPSGQLVLSDRPSWSPDEVPDRGRPLRPRAGHFDRPRGRRPDAGDRRPHRDRLGHALERLPGRGAHPCRSRTQGGGPWRSVGVRRDGEAARVNRKALAEIVLA